MKAHILLHTYRDIFNGESNLGFALPRTDTWATCDKLALKLRSSKGAEKEKLDKELDAHHKLAETAFIMCKDGKGCKDELGWKVPSSWLFRSEIREKRRGRHDHIRLSTDSGDAKFAT